MNTEICNTLVHDTACRSMTPHDRAAAVPIVTDGAMAVVQFLHSGVVQYN
jgi:hypothetical protein